MHASRVARVLSYADVSSTRAVAWQHADVVWCVAGMLMLEDSSHETVSRIWTMSLVCRGISVVLRDAMFVANVRKPWLAPYCLVLRVPRMRSMHRILEAMDAHRSHAGLLTTGCIALVALFRTDGYYMPDVYARDFMVRVVANAMAAHPASPVVLHLACLVLAWYCGTDHTLYTEVVAAGVLTLAVEAEYKYCARAIGSFPGFHTLLKSVQYHADTQTHVVKARAGRPPPAYVGYEAYIG